MRIRFSENQLARLLSTVVAVLIENNDLEEANVVVNAEADLESHPDETWNSPLVYWKILLGLSGRVFAALEGRGSIEQRINDTLSLVAERFEDDEISCSIVVALEPENDDWRLLARQRLSGVGITNQGRVRSDNIATRVHDGLLFRSRPETRFYDALKQYNVPFAPLPTVIAGRTLPNGRKRIEPDFMLFKDGIVLVVELDGDTTHRETPLEAHEREAVLKDQGVIFERVASPTSSQEAQEAAKHIMKKLEQAIRRR